MLSTIKRPDVGSKLGQRRRRWPNIEPTLGQCLVLTGNYRCSLNTPVNTKHLYDFIQCWTNVEDVGPTLYKCYTNVLCLLGRDLNPMLDQCWSNVVDGAPTLKQHWINVSCEVGTNYPANTIHVGSAS